MQQLMFESAWNRTVSTKDREKIMQAFKNIELNEKEEIQLTPLWHAFNYQNDLLITAIVHNTSNKDFSFQNQKVQYIVHNDTIATHSFTLPTIFINAKTSMPWTFIFPKGRYLEKRPKPLGKLTIMKE